MLLSHLDGHMCSDYINASYIDVSAIKLFNTDDLALDKLLLILCFFLITQGFKEKNKFIAAQGKCTFTHSFVLCP